MMGRTPKRPAPLDLHALMDSPLYWTMNVKERLALIRNEGSSRDDGAAALRQRILAGIKTGI
ncbi:MAG: hypothetical protein WB948_09485 [Desulfobaccales bacterium]